MQFLFEQQGKFVMAATGLRQIPLWKIFFAVGIHKTSGKREAQRSSNMRLNESSVGAVTTLSGSAFHFGGSLIENAAPLLARWKR